MGNAVEKIYKSGEIVKYRPKNQLKEEVKLKLDGTPKMTISGSQKGDIHLVEPLRDLEDIRKIKDYFQTKVKASETDSELEIAARNQFLFKFGINIGLRMGDILDLTWGKIYYQENTFADSIRIKEEKTGKFRDFYLNDNCKDAIDEYISIVFPIINPEMYLFRSQKGGAINVRAVNKIIQEAAKECKINYRCGTHTIRKTWAYHQLLAHPDNPLFIANLMYLLNHSSVAATLHYAGISSDQYKKYYYDVNL